MLSTSQCTTALPPELLLWDVVQEHFEEAAFHFEQWDLGLSSPVFVLDQIADGFEDRLEQHITGFLKAGTHAVERLLYPELEEMTSPEKTTLAALLLLRLSQRTMLYELLDFMCLSHDEEHRAAITRAMTLHDDPRFETVLREVFARARSPREKAMLLEVFASKRLDPGALLQDCFAIGFTPLEVAATKVAGRAGRRDMAPVIEGNLDTDDESLRAASAEAGLYLGSCVAWSIARELVTAGGDVGARAMVLVALLGNADDHRRLHPLLETEGTRNAALWALGFTGRIESAELCIQYLESDDVRTAKLASEAFGAITGLSRLTVELFLAEPGHDQVEASIGDEPIALAHDDLDADLLPDGTDDLPLLDPFEVVSWYERRRDRLSRDQRYIAGVNHGAPELIRALNSFPMRRRHELALELAIRTGARRWVDTDGFTTRQRRQLEALESVNDSEYINCFDSDEAR